MNRFHTKSGSCTIPFPPTIAPCTSGSAMFSKTPHAARGAVGVFTYDLLNKCTEKSSKKIAVMFSVPYDFNLYSNWYSVGLFDKCKECNYDLYCQMYHGSDRTFVRGKANGPGLTYKGNEVTIMATMSDTYQPVIKVQVSKNWSE